MRQQTLRGALVLALVASCAPAVRISEPTPTTPVAAGGASAVPTRIPTADRVTLREDPGPSSKLVVRSAATGDRLSELPDGVLLPDKRTMLTLSRTIDRALIGPTLLAIDRSGGQTLRSLPLSDAWSFRSTASGPGGLSANGTWLALVGSTFSSADAGKTSARSTFAVVDTALTAPPRMVVLDGSFFLDSISDDGRSLYLVQNTVEQRPVPVGPSVLRAYDLASGAFVAIAGDALPPMNGFRTDPVRIDGAAYSLVIFGDDAPYLVRLDGDARSARVLRIPTAKLPAPSSPNVPPGELALLWSMAATRDGRTLYAANPAVGVVNEIDTTTFTVRRTGKVSSAPTPSLLDAILQWIAPVADAKMIVRAGALLSSDERTLYSVAEHGIRAIDTATLDARTLVATGQLMDLALSPDGRRLYALDAAGRWMLAYDASTGALLGQVDVGAHPQAIVAVDAQ